jgi:hypothetical protein
MKLKVLKLGVAPSEEQAAHPNDKNYYEKCFRRKMVFARMLKRCFGLTVPQFGLTVSVLETPEDPIYSSQVCLSYEPANSRKETASIEEWFLTQMPTHWDAVAEYELLFMQRDQQWTEAVRDGLVDVALVPLQFLPALGSIERRIQNVPSNMSLGELHRCYPIPAPPPGFEQ